MPADTSPTKKTNSFTKEPGKTPAPPSPKTPASPEKALVTELRKSLLKISAEYGGPNSLDERYEGKLTALGQYADIEGSDVPRMVRTIVDGFFIHALSQWSKGKFSGPETRDNLQKKIDKAESLGNMLYKNGEHSAAARQYERAAEYRYRLYGLDKVDAGKL